MFAVIWKDVLLECRTRETVSSLFALGVAILLVFNFAIDIAPENAPVMAPGVLWIAIVFSAALALGRTFVIERENGCMTALLLSPMDRGVLFLAKLTVNVLLLLIFEAMLVPVFAVFFGLDIIGKLLPFAVVLFAGTLGLAATGTLFALAALGSRARELVLPLIILPLQIPLLIAAVQCTGLVLDGRALTSLGAWGHLLITFDVLFVTVGWLAFEFILVD